MKEENPNQNLEVETPNPSTTGPLSEAPIPEGEAAPPAETAPQPERKPFLYHLFSPETKLGRIMRPTVRWLGYFAGFFALGVLAVYLGLYQPMQKQAETLEMRSDALSAELSRTRSELDTLKPQVQKLTGDLELANNRITLHKTIRSVLEAQLAVETKDGPRSMVAVEKISSDMKTLIPLVQAKDPTLATLLQSRLDLIKTELSRDPTTARMDLEKLYSALIELQSSF